MTFEVGDTVQPIGWALSTPKPQGRVTDVDDSGNYRVLTVDWSNGRTSRVSAAVVEAAS